MTILVVSLAIILCIVCSGFFSSSEMAFSSCNTVRLENISEEKSKGWKQAKKALKITKNFDIALSAILIGNNLVNIAASSLGSILIILIFGNDNLAWLSTAVLTILIIIFGETIPKIKGKKNATAYAMKASGIIDFLSLIFRPLIFVVVNLIKLCTFFLKGEKDEQENQEESVEELQSIIETAEDEGIIDENDSNLMQAAIDFSEISASEVMTARVDVVAIDINDAWDKNLQIIENAPVSRIPVYEDSIDNIIGILHLNKFYKALADQETNTLFENESPIDLRALLMPPCYVYKTIKLPNVLNSLKSAKQHLAIVTDEYSGTLGVISMEDVLEQIVGEIYDETDEVEEPDVVKHNDTEFELDGDLSISEFLDITSLDESSFEAESETVGGWAVEMLGHFPEEGESFDYKNIKVKILTMDVRRVAKLLVQIVEQQ